MKKGGDQEGRRLRRSVLGKYGFEACCGLQIGMDQTVLSQVRNGPGANYTHYNVTFNSADNRSVVVFAGYWGPGPAAWEQIDDAALLGPRP